MNEIRQLIASKVSERDITFEYPRGANQRAKDELDAVVEGIQLPDIPQFSSETTAGLISELNGWVRSIEDESSRVEDAMKNVISRNGGGNAHFSNPLSAYKYSVRNAVEKLRDKLTSIADFQLDLAIETRCLKPEEVNLYYLHKLAKAIDSIDFDFPNSIGIDDGVSVDIMGTVDMRIENQ